MTKSIFICASMSFYPTVIALKSELESRGYHVYIPVSAEAMVKAQDFNVDHFKSSHTPDEKRDFFRTNFSNIEKSDALLVVNETKNGIPGYIGTSVLMEIGFAFYHKLHIYLWNQYPLEASYHEELANMGVKVVNQKIEDIHV